MKLNKFWNNHKIKGDAFFSVKFILPVLLVIIIPLVSSVIISTQMIHTYKMKTVDMYSMFLQNNMEATDQMLEKVEDTVDSMISNPQIAGFFNTADYPVSELQSIKKALTSYRLTGEYVKKVYYYNAAMGIVIDDAMSYIPAESFWELNLKQMGIAHEQWQSMTNDKSWRREYISLKGEDGNALQLVQFTQSMPVMYGSKIKGYIGVILDENALLSPYQKSLEENNASLYILNNRNEIVMETNSRYRELVMNRLSLLQRETELSDRAADGKKWGQGVLISNLSSEIHGWRFVFVMPERAALAEVYGLNAFILMVFLLCIVGVFYMTLRIANKRTREFNEIVDLIDGYGVKLKKRAGFKGMKQSEYTYIKDGLDQLIIDSQETKKQLQEQKKHVDYRVIDKIINGSYVSQEQIREELGNSDTILPNKRFVLMLLQLEGKFTVDSEYAQMKDYIMNRLFKMIDVYAYIHDMNVSKIAVIFPVDEEESARRYVKETVSRIRTELEPTVTVHFVYGVGGIAPNLMGIHRSYQEAMEVLRYNTAGYTRECLWYEELSDEEDTYYYPLELENKLFDYAILGNRVEVVNTLDRIYNENFLNRTISVMAMDKLVREMHSTVLKICKYISTTYPSVEIEDRVRETGAITEIFDSVNQVLSDVCTCVTENNKSKAKRTTERIIEYVDENYTDPDISLTRIAVNFNLSEKYVSSVFKEAIGENFSVYVEKKRIDLACRLIAEGRYNVGEIAIRVGYTNDITFRRAFKRNKDVTPTAYAADVREGNGS